METFGNVMFTIAMIIIIMMASMGLYDNQNFDGDKRSKSYKNGQWITYGAVIVLALIFGIWAGVAEHTGRSRAVKLA